MKVKMECSNCHTDLPLPEVWKRELEDPKKAAMDIEVISHGICEACIVALYGEELGAADLDLNLVFRWDVYANDEGPGYWMQIIIIQQRKGIYTPITINSVNDADVIKIVAYLKPHFDKITKNWRPIF